ncbi:MarC family protein [Streptomyces sp. NPDC059009]|uniref:MarC family protein n=1 Tax=Streptomyces sp. NPDC059009 TaxID=3346694 RepID=UPI0036D1F950
MTALTFSAAFITFFSVVGPPKVLLAFAELAQTRELSALRRIALVSSGAAVLVGLVVSVSAPWVLKLFHISTPALQLAGGIIFFLYAVGLVLGIHLGSDGPHAATPDLIGGVRELLMPYIVSPLALTAVLIEAAERENSWSWRSTVGGAYVSVIALNLVCVLLLGHFLRRTHHTVTELLVRLLGLLLAAVAVDLILDGLYDLGVKALHPPFGQ